MFGPALDERCKIVHWVQGIVTGNVGRRHKGETAPKLQNSIFHVISKSLQASLTLRRLNRTADARQTFTLLYKYYTQVSTLHKNT